MATGARVVRRSVDATPKFKRPSKYPWDEWLDGRIWYLRTRTTGGDFSCLRRSIQSQARKQALLNGKALASRIVSGGVLIQAYELGSPWKPNLTVISLARLHKATENKR